jgi:hypothetical protein
LKETWAKLEDYKFRTSKGYRIIIDKKQDTVKMIKIDSLNKFKRGYPDLYKKYLKFEEGGDIDAYANGGEVNKKNSIEWLFNHMGNESAGYETEMNTKESLDYAKQMHKKEIIDAWKNGNTELTDHSANNFAEKYYNQKFLGIESDYYQHAKGGEVKRQMDYRLTNNDEHNVEAMWLELSKDKSKTRGEIIDAISDELKINWFEISSWIKRNYKTYAQGGEIHTMSKKDKERFNELQKKDNQDNVLKKDNQDKLTKAENVEYENLLQQYKKTQEYKDYFMIDKFAKGGKVSRQFVEYTIPTWAVSSLINGNDSGLEDGDIEKINKFVDKVVARHGNAFFMLGDKSEESEFSPYNDIDSLGSDVITLYILPDDKFAKGGQVNKISTTTQVKRNLRGSGAFTLELEMAVYVPSTTVADQIISKTLFQKRIQEVEKYLSKLFGGYSSTSVEGGYVSKEKGLIKEDVAKVTAFGTEESLKKNFKPLMRQISKWCEAWGQESMGFEFEGDLYYVSKDAKFSKGGKIENKPVKPKFVKNAKK